MSSPGRTALVTICFCILLSVLCARPLSIAVIPKGTTHEFWKSIHAGAIKAQQELAGEGTAIRVIWQGPLREDDREQQIQVVENFIGRRVQGIVLAPLDSRALVRPVQTAVRARIPVVIIDSALDSTAPASYVATDNYAGGVLAADHLGGLLRGEGRILVLRYQVGSASTEAREAGFLDRISSEFPAIEIVSSDQHAGATRDTAFRASQNLLNRFGQRVDAVFTPNESSTVGMLLAVRAAGLTGRLQMVGFDASSQLVEALEAGELEGLVVQNPFRMGYLGVRTVVRVLQGEEVEPVLDTGVTLVTRENMKEAEIHELLHPPLELYLGR